MRAVQFARTGTPVDVAEVVDQPDPPAPGPGQVNVDLLAAPVNPADMMLLQGIYGHQPPLPAGAGLEGVGRVSAVGSGVGHLKVGDRVLLLGAQGTWRERHQLAAQGLFALPGGASDEQLAMLTVNPPTAHGLLHHYFDLQPGEWVIKNAANSGVGRSLFTLARRKGLRGIAVVRRPGLEDTLRSWGAEEVLVDGPDLPERVRALVGDKGLRLGIDAVGGPATARIAASLDPGGIAVNYGLLSGENPQIGAHELIFRGVTLQGFWLATWARKQPPAELGRVYTELASLIAEGVIDVEVAARYPLSRAREALTHAAREERGGKIVLVPDAAG